MHLDEQKHSLINQSGAGEDSRFFPAACTIISRNYLSHARILAASYLEHHPGARFYLLVIDDLPADVDGGQGVRVMGADELDLPFFSELCFKYDVTELCTAVKPALLNLLLERYQEDRVIYLDPDILVLKRFDELIACFAGANIVLIPHLLKPIPQDGLRPSEQDILTAGAYNLGFIAVRKSDTTLEFLRWWQTRLRDFCFVDVAHGLMTDQKWVDLVPGLFDATIFKDETYNVAYWNIHSRTLERQGQRFLVNGERLTFFHFSAFDPGHPSVFSKHQNRTQIAEGSALAALLDLYVELHRQHDFAINRKWRYGYGFFDNGVRVSLPMRRAYWRLEEEDRAAFGNPFQSEGDRSFFYWATDPESVNDVYSPFLRTLYELRPDVAAEYPDIRGIHRDEFLEWASTSGASEFGFDPEAMRLQDNARPLTVEMPATDEAFIEFTGPVGAKCSIVIPVHNYASLTLNCLEAVLANVPTDMDCEVIVTDDASTDDTSEMLATFGDRIRIVQHSLNKGFAVSCNDGAALAGGEYIIFLNNDTIPQQGWLETLVRFADARPQAAAVGSKLLFPNNTIQHAGIAICEDGEPRHLYSGISASHPAVNRSRRLQAVTGACLLVRREDFQRANGFDSSYRNGYEDVDLCLRLGVLGREVHYCHESVLYHLEAISRELKGPQDIHNRKVFKARWANRVEPDEFHYYVADGFLKAEYGPSYPIQLSISPMLATVSGPERDRQADRLIEARSRQVVGLLKDNIRLNIRVQEAELRGRVVSRNGPGSSWKTETTPFEEPRLIHKGHILWPSNSSDGRIVSIILPVKNGAPKLSKLLPAIAAQKTRDHVEIVAVDSGSSDDSVELLKQSNATVISIDPRSFNHGLTRNLATTYANGTIFVFLNQSTLPADEHWLANLVRPLKDDPSLAGVCGRVLPRPDADYLTAREINANINASTERIVTEISDWNLYRSLQPHILRALVNFHTLSAAIRADVFRRMPFREADFAEDLIWGKAAVEAGLRIQFEPSSVAFHSHNYSMLDILRRNFDDGVACQKIIGVKMNEEEIVPHMRDVLRVWSYLEKECGLEGEELEQWRLNAAVRRAAQVFGQWLGLNFHRFNQDVAALLSITSRIKAGAKTEISEDRIPHARAAR